MRIYTNGCSFTYGDELKSPNDSAWPVLLSKKLNGQIVNDAVSGGTNQRTVYRTIKNLEKEFDLYIIAWTTYSRFTFYKSDNNFEINFTPTLTHSDYKDKSSYRDWGKILYTEWYNELYAFKLWLQQIIQLQAVLKNKNYLMINTTPNRLKFWLTDKDHFIDSVKKFINFSLMNDEQIFEEFREIQYYTSIIDNSKFYQWREFAITDLCSNYLSGPGGHILEDGHAHVANLIYNHIHV
jgi:hypothetical protein